MCVRWARARAVRRLVWGVDGGGEVVVVGEVLRSCVGEGEVSTSTSLGSELASALSEVLAPLSDSIRHSTHAGTAAAHRIGPANVFSSTMSGLHGYLMVRRGMNAESHCIEARVAWWPVLK